MATTGTNEYWMNDFNQPQKSHSSLGTIKDGDERSAPGGPHRARDQPEGDDGERRIPRQ